MSQSTSLVHAVIIESDQPLTLEQITQALKVQQTFIEQLVQHDLLEPVGEQPKDWQFDSDNLRRARIAVNLYHDLDINFAGIQLAIDLLEQKQALEQELEVLKQHLALD